MKACVIQPPYSRDLALADAYFDEKLAQLQSCDETMDVIVLPEYSDVPCAAETLEDTLRLHDAYMPRLLDACRETAVRCKAAVFFNALSPVDGGWRNTTFAVNPRGEIAGKYYKRHLPPSELAMIGDPGNYTLQAEAPYVLEMDGVRYGFLTCYDFYFYEAFPALARQQVDVIIGCSLQRSDPHEASEIMCRFLAYNTNAYVLRASVSFGEDAQVCGASMIVSPKGQVLCNLKGRFGMGCAEFDPHDKYYKAAGYGNPPAAHHAYIEWGRKPWQYRPGGSALVPFEKDMPYPRICAHRGFSTVAPENSMPAFGAAVALGAKEIEFDLWPTRDGVIVSCHDDTLERVSDGQGLIYECTYEELKKLDFGVKFGNKFQGLPIVTFEEILQKLGGQTIMNVHIKPLPGQYDPAVMKTIVALIRRYDCQRHVYFMISEDDTIRMFKAYAPDIPICVGHDFARPWSIVDRAIELGAQKVQLFKPYLNQEMIDKAHVHGILCNVFFADEPEEAQRDLDMGIDVILTNDYQRISHALGMK